LGILKIPVEKLSAECSAPFLLSLLIEIVSDTSRDIAEITLSCKLYGQDARIIQDCSILANLKDKIENK